MNIQLNQTTLQPVKSIKIPDVFYRRVKTGIKEFDDFLSGGWLPGSVFTFTARAGLGKSTLMLQVLDSATRENYKAAYISCEESVFQIAYNCERFDVKDLEIANISDIDAIVQLMSTHNILIIDSFQGLTTKHNFNSKEHEKYCIERLITEAKKTECVVGIICHQTKSGSLKGSSLILHEVDANMELGLPEEMQTEEQRLLSFSKNRFGKVWEMACEMGDKGYIFTSAIEKQSLMPGRKVPKREQIWNQILEMPGDITLKRIMPLVDGNVMKAVRVLREMVLNEMLLKNGRGNEATYQKTQTSSAGVPVNPDGGTCLPEAADQTREAGPAGQLGGVLCGNLSDLNRSTAEIQKVLEYFNT